jgi:4'-phosphopantetheinyl transferase
MQPLIQSAKLQFWCAYPADLLDASAFEACAALLSAEERSRAARLRFPRHRREFIAGRALLRTALAMNHRTPAAEWRFTANAQGKPAAEPACGLSFNLTNCEELAACLVGEGAEVGIDAEPLTRAEQILPLAARVFSPREQSQLEALPAAQRPGRALSLWVLKEAYIKARGLGLAIPLRQFSFQFDNGRIQFEIEPCLQDRPERWSFCLFDHAGHRVAAMLECPGNEHCAIDLQFWESRPPHGPARRLAHAPVQWFTANRKA